MAVSDAEFLALSSMVADLSDEVAKLAGSIASLGSAARPRPWVWSQLSDDQRAEAWAELRGWVLGHVVDLGAGKLADWPACWPQHRAVVEHLSALYVAWQGAYLDPRALPTAAVDFLDRSLPAGLARISALLGDCGRSHEPIDPTVPGIETDPQLKEIVPRSGRR